MRWLACILLLASSASALTVSGINNGPDGTIVGCSTNTGPGCVISDRMVLQMGLDANGRGAHIWGTAAPGDTIIATLVSRNVSAPSPPVPNVDANGNYDIYFSSLDPTTLPSQGETLHLQEIGVTNTAIDFANVLVGEVVECFGQSNVASNDGDQGAIVQQLQLLPTYAFIRSYSNANTTTVDNLIWSDNTGVGPTPNFTCWMTAVGLYEVEKVPIGIVNKAVGGTTIQCWSVAGAPGCLQAVNATGTCYTNHIVPINGYSHHYVIWWQGEANSNASTYDGMLEQLICSYRARGGQADTDYWTTVMLPLGAETISSNLGAGPWKWLPETVANSVGSPACSDTTCTGWFTNIQPANPPADSSNYWPFWDGMNRDFWIATVNLTHVSTVVSTDYWVGGGGVIHPASKMTMAHRLAQQFLADALNIRCLWQGCSTGAIMPTSAALVGDTFHVTTKFGTGNGMLGMAGFGLNGFMVSSGDSGSASPWLWVPATLDETDSSTIVVQPSSAGIILPGPQIARLRYGSHSAASWNNVTNSASRPLSPFEFDRNCISLPCAQFVVGNTPTPLPTATPTETLAPGQPTFTPTETFTPGPSPTPTIPACFPPAPPLMSG